MIRIINLQACTLAYLWSENKHTILKIIAKDDKLNNERSFEYKKNIDLHGKTISDIQHRTDIIMKFAHRIRFSASRSAKELFRIDTVI